MINFYENDINKTGIKAHNLLDLKEQGFKVPDFIVLSTDIFDYVTKDKGINSISFPDELKEEIYKKIDIKKSYAVRSSSLKEDTALNSFAGQYETYLNIKGEDIFSSIIKCYKSMYSETVLSYIEKNFTDFDFNTYKMAVIIQEMAPGYNGVLFTVNPVSGNDKEFIAEISPTLKKQAVDADINPIKISANWYENIVSIDNISGTFMEDKLSIYKEQIINLGLKIQKKYKYPCDIEFAISDEGISLLQVRQITKLMYQGIEGLYTIANFKDGGVSSSNCPMLMYSLYKFIWDDAIKSFLLSCKIATKEELKAEQMQMYFAKPYWNLQVVKKAMSNIPGYSEKIFNKDLGIYNENDTKTSLSLRGLSILFAILKEKHKIIKQNKIKVKKLNEIYNTYLEKLNAGVDNIFDTFIKLIEHDYKVAETTYFKQVYLNTILLTNFKGKCLKYMDEYSYLDLLSELEYVSHMRPIIDFWELSRTLRKENSSYFEKDLDLIEKDYYDKTEDFSYLDDIIKKYGYHSTRELDIMYPCYDEDIREVLSKIKNYVSLLDEAIPIKKDGRYNKALSLIKNKSLLKRELKEIRYLLLIREELKDISTKFYYLIRKFTLLLSKKFVSEGLLREEDDIFFISYKDIKNIYSIKNIYEIIDKNKLYYNAFENYNSSQEIGSEQASDTAKTNKGIGCSKGIVTGKALVVESLEHITELKKEDILVTKYIDTGFTSKFPSIKGIVTEFGGVLCHTSIIAREYGIPYIVGYSDITKIIKNGDCITINGSTGEVTIN